MTDILIIGAGPAGMTAAIYAVRAGVSAMILESNLYGGQIANTPDIENYPSIQKIAGWELAQNIYDQVVAKDVEVRFETVRGIELEGDTRVVVTDENRYEAKTVIIANGAKRRLIGCPGEEEFSGRGVSYCATCDGAFFKGKTAAVIGGGNTALEDALYLSNLCAKVYLIHRRDSFRGERHLVNAVLARDNIEVLYSYVPVRILGEDAVNALEIQKAGGEEKLTLRTDAVFVAIGLNPDNAVFSNLIALDQAGYVVAGEDCATNIRGIFAAGDTRTKQVRQIVTAAADGAVAAIQAANVVNAGRA